MRLSKDGIGLKNSFTLMGMGAHSGLKVGIVITRIYFDDFVAGWFLPIAGRSCYLCYGLTMDEETMNPPLRPFGFSRYLKRL